MVSSRVEIAHAWCGWLQFGGASGKRLHDADQGWKGGAGTAELKEKHGAFEKGCFAANEARDGAKRT